MKSKSILVGAMLLMATGVSQAALAECLYGSTTITLAEIDPLDGSYTTIITSNYPTFQGLALTPEPATLLLLGLGGLALRLKRRRCSSMTASSVWKSQYNVI